MTRPIFALLALAISELAAAEAPPQAKPVWYSELHGQSPGPVVSNSEHVIAPGIDLECQAMMCFEVIGGSLIWVHRYVQKAAASTNGKALAFRDVVFFLYANGKVEYVDLKTGATRWEKKNIAEEFDAYAPLKGYASTPLFYDGKLFINPGAQDASIVALDPKTGETIWKTPGRRASRSDFIAAEFGGVKQLIGFDHDALGGWDVKSGARLWQLDTPDRIEDASEKVFESIGQLLSSTSDGNTTLYRFNANGTLDEKAIARNTDSKRQIQALVGRLALCIGGGVICLNLDAGLRECWRLDETEIPNASYILVEGRRMAIFSSDGTVSIFEISATKAERCATWKLCDAIVAQPMVSNGKLFVRSATRLYCFDIDNRGIGLK